MDIAKKTIALVMVLFAVCVTPVHAQMFGGENPYGQMDPMGSMGQWGGMGQTDPFMSGMGYPGMDGMQGMGGMPFMFPGMSINREHAVKINSLPIYSGQGSDMMATLEGVPQISVYAAILKAEGFEKDLKGRGNYLIFAPTDKALSRDYAVKDARTLIDDKGFVKGIIENSIVYQKEGEKYSNLTALNGKEIVVLKTRQGYSANGADVVGTLNARNGMLIVTDGAVGT